MDIEGDLFRVAAQAEMAAEREAAEAARIALERHQEACVNKAHDQIRAIVGEQFELNAVYIPPSLYDHRVTISIKDDLNHEINAHLFTKDGKATAHLLFWFRGKWRIGSDMTPAHSTWFKDMAGLGRAIAYVRGLEGASFTQEVKV